MSDNKVTFQGNPLTILGNDVKVGQTGPDVELVGNDLSAVKISDYKGKIVVITVVPSLDTPVCDTMTRKFNEEATKLSDDVVVLAVSVDLPFAQARWCGGAGVERVVTLSDHRDAAFGEAYGVLVGGLRLLARSVFVLDKEGVIRYVQVVPELTDEPDYSAVLDAVGGLV